MLPPEPPYQQPSEQGAPGFDPNRLAEILRAYIGQRMGFGPGPNPLAGYITDPIGAQSFGRTDDPGDALRGYAGAGYHVGPGFEWGGRMWGPGDAAAFAAWLTNHGRNFSTWAAAHPGAAGLFNIPGGAH